MKKETKITVDWNSPNSIRFAEEFKSVLENSGYHLVRMESGFTTSTHYYEPIKEENDRKSCNTA